MQLGFGIGIDARINLFQWPVTNSIGSVALFQTSSNLTNWVTLFSATNDGASWYFENVNPNPNHQFYRVIPR